LIEISKLGKPIVLVLYAGRSLILTKYTGLVDSILYTWHLGTMAGPAIVDLLFGVRNPSGRLPLSFLKDQGQIPLYYNKKRTGKTPMVGYIDLDSNPLWSFGFGLSYSDIKIDQFSMSKDKIGFKDTL
jgi:beta-glucosidase